MNCSPFIVGAVITHLLENCPEELHETAEKLKRLFYVGNCVDSEKELHQFVNEASQLMLTAKFNLRDWKYTQNEHKFIRHRRIYRRTRTSVGQTLCHVV